MPLRRRTSVGGSGAGGSSPDGCVQPVYWINRTRVRSIRFTGASPLTGAFSIASTAAIPSSTVECRVLAIERAGAAEDDEKR